MRLCGSWESRFFLQLDKPGLFCLTFVEKAKKNYAHQILP